MEINKKNYGRIVEMDLDSGISSKRKAQEEQFSQVENSGSKDIFKFEIC